MKKQVFYVHGGESFSDYNKFIERLKTKDIWDLPTDQPKKKWTDSLASDLGADFEVFSPRMPNANNAKYEEWKIWFERHFEYLRDEVILVGCSLGAMFLAKYAIENEFQFKVKMLILMASPVKTIDFTDEDCGDFVFTPEQISNISSKVEKIVIMHSKDDFLVPYEHALEFKKQLPEAELVTFEDKNHFLVPELPELIELIKAA